MSTIPYVPIPVFSDRDTVIEQIKAIQNGESAEALMTSWLNACFAHTKIMLPDFVHTDYQVALQFLHTYRGSTDRRCCIKENQDTSSLILIKTLCNTSALGYTKNAHSI